MPVLTGEDDEAEMDRSGTEGPDLRPAILSRGGSSDDRSAAKVPRVSKDYFFLGVRGKRRTSTKASTLTTKELRRQLETAGIASGGRRSELVDQYDQFIKGTLAEEGLSSPSEAEEEEDN